MTQSATIQSNKIHRKNLKKSKNPSKISNQKSMAHTKETKGAKAKAKVVAKTETKVKKAVAKVEKGKFSISRPGSDRQFHTHTHWRLSVFTVTDNRVGTTINPGGSLRKTHSARAHTVQANFPPCAHLKPCLRLTVAGKSLGV